MVEVFAVTNIWNPNVHQGLVIWLHNVNVCATECALRKQILCYAYFTTIFKILKKQDKTKIKLHNRMTVILFLSKEYTNVYIYFL